MSAGMTVRRWPWRVRRDQGERGSMAVEIVLLAPVMMLFVLLIVMFGRYVAVRGDIDAAARDAARAASLQTSHAQGLAAARTVVEQSLDSQTDCSSTSLSPNWAAGETVTVRLTCKVSYEGLGLLGVPGSMEMVTESRVPLDPYRRFE